MPIRKKRSRVRIANLRNDFAYIEEQLRINGRTFDQTDLTEMDHLWEEAKRFPRKIENLVPNSATHFRQNSS